MVMQYLSGSSTTTWTLLEYSSMNDPRASRKEFSCLGDWDQPIAYNAHGAWYRYISRRTGLVDIFHKQTLIQLFHSSKQTELSLV